ncbi:hypothetical protein [Pseudobacteriovorax antillogorgiicola]|uniref:Uncharacterized protein n=1 Tax=Pseudobacteriovorax antillogorgiicola TaxID=1513793 RepID=A0A1Y6BD58_9BACT|nr:hypothetical protein [Pseudobacteriovorax antillogorgiicola]TCS56447.1 hypothetical protein EDD56_104269 [Pseudobacteriovorax antillogorgiicola]SMF05345.1 hypothetical protein SAMN06296036_10464 [Pseudobacteriovorax antillogorgiicola]
MIKELWDRIRGQNQGLTIKINEHLSAIAQESEGHYSICYLFIGVHGNTLIGLPPRPGSFRQFFIDRGGVKQVFPFRTSHHLSSAAEEIFRTFGCRFIFTSHAGPWSVPWLSLDETFQHGFHVTTQTDDEGETSWLVKTRGQSFLVGSYKQTHSDESTELRLRNQWSVPPLPSDLLDRRLSTSSLAERQELIDLLCSQKILLHQSPHVPLIALFDDIEFEASDYEVISPKARMQLDQALTELGAIRFRNRFYRWRQWELEISRPPRSLASPPLANIETKHQKLIFVTPTQFFIYVMESFDLSHRDKKEITLALVAALPVNLRKLARLLPDVWRDEVFLMQLKRTQKASIEHFKSRRPRGIIGHPNREKPRD